MRYKFSKVKLTYHAIQRAKEFNIPIKKAVWMVWNAEKEEGKFWDKDWKLKKYGEKQEGVYTVRYDTVLFTVKLEPNKRNPDQFNLVVITLFDQKMNHPQ